MQKRDPLKNKRIFVGFNYAGAPGIYAFTRALRKRGYKIDFYGIKEIRYGMPVDFLLRFSSSKIISFFERFIYFFKILPQYDLWHFNYIEAFFWYPLNLFILKLFGKKIVSTFRGSDVRTNIDFLPLNLYKKIPSNSWPIFYQQNVVHHFWQKFLLELRIKIFCWLSDQVVIIGPFLASSVPHYDKMISYAQDLKVIGSQKIANQSAKGRKITILHAPSDFVTKGSETVKGVFAQLSKKYLNCNFKIMPKMPHKELLAEMAKADIVIDQLLVGWYGLQAVEAMAMGKIVVAFLNPAYLPLVSFDKNIPIWNSNVWTFSQDIENLLILYPKISGQWATKSIQFVRKKSLRRQNC